LWKLSNTLYMRKFSIGIGIRVGAILLLAWFGTWQWQQGDYGLVGLSLLLMAAAAHSLYRYATMLNKKLSRLFDAIQYQDFAITFRADNAKGDSFEELNNSLNAVIRSFNLVRAEREATIHFIQAIIQQINVGILSYTTDGKIEIVNQAANKLLAIYKLSHISSIRQHHPDVYETMVSLPSGESRLLKVNHHECSLSVKEIMLRDRKIRLIALHNIRSELQARELEAWQNLTKVLRHEIMNSVTPIVSLSETMKDIIELDLANAADPQEKAAIEDLKNASSTIINRSKGIMKFVNAYREFTNIPLPNRSEITASQLLQRVQTLFEQQAGAEIRFEIKKDFKLFVDPDQIEQVLINIIKNAIEADYGGNRPLINVTATVRARIKSIEIADNGLGLPPELADQIFVPFYTSKPTGTGIGLSLSRQIIQLHEGTLHYSPNVPRGAVFTIAFG
jgi:two-component system, NtrC family, nitrogen regulation sensor histidine kinase NtrY